MDKKPRRQSLALPSSTDLANSNIDEDEKQQLPRRFPTPSMEVRLLKQVPALLTDKSRKGDNSPATEYRLMLDWNLFELPKAFSERANIYAAVVAAWEERAAKKNNFNALQMASFSASKEAISPRVVDDTLLNSSFNAGRKKSAVASKSSKEGAVATTAGVPSHLRCCLTGRLMHEPLEMQVSVDGFLESGPGAVGGCVGLFGEGESPAILGVSPQDPTTTTSSGVNRPVSPLQAAAVLSPEGATIAGSTLIANESAVDQYLDYVGFKKPSEIPEPDAWSKYGPGDDFLAGIADLILLHQRNLLSSPAGGSRKLNDSNKKEDDNSSKERKSSITGINQPAPSSPLIVNSTGNSSGFEQDKTTGIPAELGEIDREDLSTSWRRFLYVLGRGGTVHSASWVKAKEVEVWLNQAVATLQQEECEPPLELFRGVTPSGSGSMQGRSISPTSIMKKKPPAEATASSVTAPLAAAEKVVSTSLQGQGHRALIDRSRKELNEESTVQDYCIDLVERIYLSASLTIDAKQAIEDEKRAQDTLVSGSSENLAYAPTNFQAANQDPAALQRELQAIRNRKAGVLSASNLNPATSGLVSMAASPRSPLGRSANSTSTAFNANDPPPDGSPVVDESTSSVINYYGMVIPTTRANPAAQFTSANLHLLQRFSYRNSRRKMYPHFIIDMDLHLAKAKQLVPVLDDLMSRKENVRKLYRMCVESGKKLQLDLDAAVNEIKRLEMREARAIHASQTSILTATSTTSSANVAGRRGNSPLSSTTASVDQQLANTLNAVKNVNPEVVALEIRKEIGGVQAKKRDLSTHYQRSIQLMASCENHYYALHRCIYQLVRRLRHANRIIAKYNIFIEERWQEWEYLYKVNLHAVYSICTSLSMGSISPTCRLPMMYSVAAFLGLEPVDMIRDLEKHISWSKEQLVKLNIEEPIPVLAHDDPKFKVMNENCDTDFDTSSPTPIPLIDLDIIMQKYYEAPAAASGVPTSNNEVDAAAFDTAAGIPRWVLLGGPTLAGSEAENAQVEKFAEMAEIAKMQSEQERLRALKLGFIQGGRGGVGGFGGSYNNASSSSALAAAGADGPRSILRPVGSDRRVPWWHYDAPDSFYRTSEDPNGKQAAAMIRKQKLRMALHQEDQQHRKEQTHLLKLNVVNDESQMKTASGEVAAQIPHPPSTFPLGMSTSRNNVPHYAQPKSPPRSRSNKQIDTTTRRSISPQLHRVAAAASSSEIYNDTGHGSGGVGTGEGGLNVATLPVRDAQDQLQLPKDTIPTGKPPVLSSSAVVHKPDPIVKLQQRQKELMQQQQQEEPPLPPTLLCPTLPMIPGASALGSGGGIHSSSQGKSSSSSGRTVMQQARSQLPRGFKNGGLRPRDIDYSAFKKKKKPQQQNEGSGAISNTSSKTPRPPPPPHTARKNTVDSNMSGGTVGPFSARTGSIGTPAGGDKSFMQF